MTTDEARGETRDAVPERESGPVHPGKELDRRDHVIAGRQRPRAVRARGRCRVVRASGPAGTARRISAEHPAVLYLLRREAQAAVEVLDVERNRVTRLEVVVEAHLEGAQVGDLQLLARQGDLLRLVELGNS